MVRRMLRRSSSAALAALALSLSACGLGERSEASKAIAGFLAAAQKGDRTAFEAVIDRNALRSDLADQMSDVGKNHGLDVGEPPSEFVLDRMINPRAVSVLAARTAPNWPASPTSAQIIPHMKVRDYRHVCLEEQATKQCLLTFTKRDGAWRLTAMPAIALHAQPLQP